MNKGEVSWKGLWICYKQQPYDGGPYEGEVEILNKSPIFQDQDAFEAYLMEDELDELEYPFCANVGRILAAGLDLRGHVTFSPMWFDQIITMVQSAAMEIFANPTNEMITACIEDNQGERT